MDSDPNVNRAGAGLSQWRYPAHEDQPEFATGAVFDDEAATG
jgi:hypothetical protein